MKLPFVSASLVLSSAPLAVLTRNTHMPTERASHMAPMLGDRLTCKIEELVYDTTVCGQEDGPMKIAPAVAPLSRPYRTALVSHRPRPWRTA